MAVLRFWLRHPGPCFVLVGANLVFASTFAGATRDGIRPGMTITEAVAAPRGLFLAVGSAQAVDGSTAHVSFGCRDQDRCWVEVGGQRTTVARLGLPATLESALGERAVVRRLTFHFRGRMLPLTTSFEVEFDPQGRVSRISPMRSWD